MRVNARFLTFAMVLCGLFAYGCGEGGGCGAPPKQEDAPSSSGGVSGAHAGGGGGGDIIISDKDRKRNVPKPYQRTSEEAAANKTPAPPGVPQAASTAPAASTDTVKKSSLPVARVIRRRVDGISNRVEVKCRVMAMSSDGECSSAANYAEIKERCCPGGIVERCKVGMRGVVLIGLDCEKPQ